MTTYTPAVVILITVNFSTQANASDETTPSNAGSDKPADLRNGLHEPALQAAKYQQTGSLIIPVDLSSSADSQFIQRLLLSHGIEIDLGPGQHFTSQSYQALLESFELPADKSQAAALTPVNRQPPDLPLAISTSRQLAVSRSVYTADEGVTDWAVTRIEPHTQRPTKESNSIPNEVRSVSDLVNINSADDAPSKVRAQALGVDPDYVIDIERAPLPIERTPQPEEDQKVDDTALASMRRSNKKEATSDTGIPAKRNKNFDQLRQWLNERSLQINLSDPCPFTGEEILEIIDHAQRDGDVDVLLDLAIATGNEPLEAGVSEQWQVRHLGCLDNTADPIDIELGSPEKSISKTPSSSQELPQTEIQLTPQPTSTPTPTPTPSPSPSPSPSQTVDSTPGAPSTQSSELPPTGSDFPPTQIPGGLPKNGLPPAAGRLPSAPSGNETFSESGGIFSFGDEVPEGFGALDGPVTQIVDIYFNEQKVGITSVTVIVDELIFDDPLEALGFLDGAKNYDELLTVISQPLATNAYLLCFATDDPPGCGTVEANPLAVIYDESSLRVDLFLAPDYQSTQFASRTRYLPPPEKRNTSILSLYSTFSRFANEEDSADLSARALLGYGFGNLTAEADYNSRNEQERIRQLKLTHYFRDYEVAVGTYPFQLNSGLSDLNVLGASFATTYKTRVDLETAFSSELVVYLTRRSIVQLVVNDRVYFGDTYGAGNQAIDTSSLPDGTYEVEIRILEADSEPRIERRIFTKSTQIPPRGETVIEATAGVPVFHEDNSVYPTATDVPLLGFSLSKRINNRSAYRLGLLQIDSRTMMQADAWYLGELISLQAGGTIGEEDTFSTSLRASFGTDALSFNLSANTFISNVNDTDDVSQAVYGNQYEQFSASLNQNFSSYSLSARAGIRRDLQDDSGRERNQYSLIAQRNLFRRKNLRAIIEAEWQQNGDEQRIGLNFNLYTGGRHWNSVFSAGGNQTDGDQTDYLLSSDVNWQPETESRNRYRFGAFANSRPSVDAVGISTEFDSPWFRASAASEWSQTDAGMRGQNSVATLSAHLGLDRRGIAMGGADFAQSGVIIDVSGEPAGTRFDIILNGIKLGNGAIGSRQFIGLQPFERYQVKLVPQTILSNGIGEDIYEFTLYPGSVQRIAITARREVLLIATLTDPDGTILENAVIDRKPNPIVIDETGLLQAELSPGELITVRKNDDSLCQFTVPDLDEWDDEVLVPADPIICQQI